MINKGVRFEIPNECGNPIADILEPVDCESFDWGISSDEVHIIDSTGITNDMLFERNSAMLDGKIFNERINTKEYYMIFATLEAFPKGKYVRNSKNYSEFLASDSEFIFAAYDSSYVFIICKSDELLEKFYLNAVKKGYENIGYIEESHLIENKCYWD